MARPKLLFLLCALVCVGSVAEGSKIADWLITKLDIPAKFKQTKNGFVLDNGIIRRDFISSPAFGTLDFYSYERKQSIFRAVEPEATIALDSIVYDVGSLVSSAPRSYMNRSAIDFNRSSSAFAFSSYKISKPEAPFPYKPMRGAPRDIVWPPKGITVALLFKPPTSAPREHQDITITVFYEMYEGIPLISKWIKIEDHSQSARQIPVKVTILSVEQLAVNDQWGDASADTRNKQTNLGWLYIETDQAHGTAVNWSADSSQAKEFGSYEPIVNCTYSPLSTLSLTREGVTSFRVHELVIGSSDRERAALARHRMFRLLAPHTQENPIFFHMVKNTPSDLKFVIDQMAEVGFEMMIYSFGSGINVESIDEEYIQQIAEIVSYAHAKGIEVGAYDLIALTRQAPKSEWMAVDKDQKSIGSSCFASDWYDYLLDRVLNFMNKTGLSMLETDGPYGGYGCASTNHSHHENFDDSVYWQNYLQGKFFTIMREKLVYLNQPDNYFYQGGSKTGMGYNEHQYTLPRWEDLSISRQTVYDNTFVRIPTVGWMFLPMVPYHSGPPSSTFEPLGNYSREYEWALAQYLGAGVAACYRGYRLYDGPETKAIVSKWVAFYKQHRDILISDIVHVRRPDMQSFDSFLHINPFLPEKGLAMVFNPTAQRIHEVLTLPLYYTGLNSTARISEQGQISTVYTLSRDYTVDVRLDMEPYTITWFLIQ